MARRSHSHGHGYARLALALALSSAAANWLEDTQCENIIEAGDHIMLTVKGEVGDQLVFESVSTEHTHAVVEEGEMPPEWHAALVGACEGDTVKVKVPDAEDAFGGNALFNLPTSFYEDYPGEWTTTVRVHNVTKNEDYAIFEHIGNESLTDVDEMFKAGKGVNAVDEFGYTPLMHAVKLDRSAFHLTLFGLLINSRKARTNVNAQRASGHTALHYAAVERDITKLTALLRRGADPNVAITMAGKFNGFTPLHFAAHEGKKKFVEVLLRFGANPTAVAAKGATALDVARWNEKNVDRYLDDLGQMLLEASRQREAFMDEL
mmetsp:Transcript_39972/g.125075  ORF Transcript_39972/g.125075 Transcript_39972/m.125075 type:complete len:320 (-) Transcript_39972:91-1050(-)